MTRLASRLRSESGFSLVEMLVTTLILVLATACMTVGVSFATRQYRESRVQSEGRTLLSTLRSAVEGELVGATTVTLDDDDNVVSFFNSVYGDSSLTCVRVDGGRVVPVEDGGLGELYVGDENGDGRLLVGSATYSSYGLGARVTELSYDAGDNVFHVGLDVGDGVDVIDSSSFDVRPTNKLVVLR